MPLGQTLEQLIGYVCSGASVSAVHEYVASTIWMYHCANPVAVTGVLIRMVRDQIFTSIVRIVSVESAMELPNVLQTLNPRDQFE